MHRLLHPMHRLRPERPARGGGPVDLSSRFVRRRTPAFRAAPPLGRGAAVVAAVLAEARAQAQAPRPSSPPSGEPRGRQDCRQQYDEPKRACKSWDHTLATLKVAQGKAEPVEERALWTPCLSVTQRRGLQPSRCGRRQEVREECGEQAATIRADTQQPLVFQRPPDPVMGLITPHPRRRRHRAQHERQHRRGVEQDAEQSPHCSASYRAIGSRRCWGRFTTSRENRFRPS